MERDQRLLCSNLKTTALSLLASFPVLASYLSLGFYMEMQSYRIWVSQLLLKQAETSTYQQQPWV